MCEGVRPGAAYHVMARGNHGQAIYADDLDRKVWLETLAEACEKTGWRIHAYQPVDKFVFLRSRHGARKNAVALFKQEYHHSRPDPFQTADQYGFYGYMGEFMLFNRVLTDDERATVTAYLRYRYNLY